MFAFLARDMGMKAVALGAAVLLWGAVTALGTRTVVLTDIPVTPINLPADLGINERLRPVAVRVRLPRSFALPDTPATIVHALVDLSGSGLGARTAVVNVTPTDPRVDVLQVTPASLSVTLDPIVERTLPVRVVPTGTPGEGYSLGEVTATPETVKVRAALGMTKTVSAIDAPISVEGATALVESEVPLDLPPGAQATPARVRARVTIEEAEITKTLGVRVITRGTPAPGYWVRTITTDPATVTVQGPRERVDALTVVETEPVSLEGAQRLIEGKTKLVFPSNVRSVDDRADLTTRIDIALGEGIRDLAGTVSVVDVPDGMRVESVSPPTIRVTVKAEEAAVNALRADDVRVVVSVAGRGAGTVTIRPTVESVRVPAGVRVIGVEGRDVSVRLEES